MVNDMKTNLISKVVWGGVLAALFVCTRADAAVNTTDTLELIRSLYKTDRQAVVAQALQLTERESNAFWPLYRSYRADMDKIGDNLVELVLEYADSYPNLSEDKAARLLKRHMTLEKQLVAKRNSYLKRAGKILPANKVLRWAQIENRLDLALRLQLASAVPLVPSDKGKPATTQ
jgi:hypothetical protein